MGDDRVLVRFQYHRLRLDLHLLQAVDQKRHQVRVLEGGRRQVDEQVRGATLALEFRQRAQRLVHHPAVNRRHQSRGFRRRHELAGFDGLVLWAGEAQQHLEHLGRFAVQVDDRLVGEMEFVFLERRPQPRGPDFNRGRVERRLRRAGLVRFRHGRRFLDLRRLFRQTENGGNHRLGAGRIPVDECQTADTVTRVGLSILGERQTLEVVADRFHLLLQGGLVAVRQ